MNKLLLALSLFATPVFAEPVEFKTTHICDTYKNIVSYAMVEFKETMLFTGVGFPVYYRGEVKEETEAYMQFFVNQSSGSWTLIYIFQDRTACIMDAGAEFKPYSN